jgi:hypothetical protein
MNGGGVQSHAWRTAHYVRLLPRQSAALPLLAAILVFKTITMTPEQAVYRTLYDQNVMNC